MYRQRALSRSDWGRVLTWATSMDFAMKAKVGLWQLWSLRQWHAGSIGVCLVRLESFKSSSLSAGCRCHSTTWHLMSCW